MIAACVDNPVRTQYRLRSLSCSFVNLMFACLSLTATGGFFFFIGHIIAARAGFSGDLMIEESIGLHSIVSRLDYMSVDELREFATLDDLARWQRSGGIFSIEHEGALLYPRYGFDFGPSFLPRPAMMQILSALHEYDAWHIAFWFSAGYGMLDGRGPKDVIASDQDAVIAAARDQAIGITHG